VDENEILETLKDRLEQIGYDYESLTTPQKRHLFRIESEISRRLTEQKQALETIKGNKINIASITSAVNITRKTAYNNQVLKDYIEYSSTLYEANYPASSLVELKEQIAEYKEIIDQMVRRDVNIENLKSEIAELQKELMSYKEQVTNILKDNVDLTIQLKSYEKKKKIKSSLNIVK
jgi:enamine deaminase RidA (YjgF/YER057c/UK114 family)